MDSLALAIMVALTVSGGGAFALVIVRAKAEARILERGPHFSIEISPRQPRSTATAKRGRRLRQASRSVRRSVHAR